MIHVRSSTTVGGVEVSLVGWLEHLDRERFSARLFCFEEPGGAHQAFRTYLTGRQLPAETLPWGRRKRLLAAVAQVADEAARHPRSLIHTHDTRSDGVGLMAGRRARVPVVSSDHGWHSMWHSIGPKVRLAERVRAQFLRRSDAVIDVSQATRDETVRRGVPAERVHTVYSGIDLDPFTEPQDGLHFRERWGIPADAAVIGSVARLYPEKGQAHLLEAATSVLAAQPRAYVLLVGDGPEEPALRAKIERQGIGDRVKLIPFQDDLPGTLAAIDVLAHPSLVEGAPLVLYAAMASGLAICATAVGGVGEFLQHGRNALVVPVGDVPALASTLAELVANPIQRKELGEGARLDAFADPRFSVRQGIRAVENIYSGLLS